jgi:hypothetical protein
MTERNGYDEKPRGTSESAEVNMFQLRSVVSQRQRAVQLATRLLQTVHDTAKRIIANIGGGGGQ